MLTPHTSTLSTIAHAFRVLTIKRAYLLCLFMVATLVPIQAQQQGSWQAFLAYYDVTRIVEGGGRVWVLASGNVMSYDVNTGESTTYSKGSPLSDAGIADINYNATVRALLVLYSNGNIDILHADGSVVNVPDYYNKAMTEDKTVTNIVMVGRHAYLTTMFGIIKLNMARGEIDDTYNMGTQVNDVLVEGNTLFAATVKGLYRGNITSNLMQPSAWTQLNTTPWMMVARLKSQLYAASDTYLCTINEANGSSAVVWSPHMKKVQKTADRLLFYAYSPDVLIYTADGHCTSQHIDNTYSWLYDATTNTWWVGSSKGVAQQIAFESEQSNAPYSIVTPNILPNSPRSNHFARIKLRNATLYSVPGRGTGELPGAVQVWDGDNWTFFDDTFAETLSYNYRGITDLCFDPTDASHITVSGIPGIFQFKDGQLWRRWNLDNSPLQHAETVKDPASWPNYTCVFSCAIDNKGTLWATNSISGSTSLLSLTKDGTWTQHPNSNLMVTVNGKQRSMDMMKSMMFDSRNLLWFVNDDYRKPALIAYDTENDVMNVYTSFINEDGAAVQVTGVRCVVEDIDHNMWIGTNAGPLMLEVATLESGGTVFNQVKVPRNDGTNLADYLLANVGIKCMAIDGAGRKWMGTDDNGIYLISADNMEQIAHFTTDNSPLPSNEIESVAVDGRTGRVYIGTAVGLCSYMSDASEPAETMTKDNVYAYPNPVRPDYNGLVTVTGLTLNADVKIVTTNGTLVAEGRSNGGTFTWDATDQKGRRVASGVYMVQTATADGKKGTVCKIAVVN